MDKLLINYLRLTSLLQIESANSGHPGVCLDGAPIAYEIYKSAFINPQNTDFINRDRIVFSAGHASALNYACLNLFNYDVKPEDLKNFRQLGSITSGHPEYNITPGVDASTGPLGQGIGISVGLSIAESFLRHKFEKGNLKPINHYTYCFVGDGDLMEGVAQESISLAGTLKLSHLILLYDKNDITIEGSTTLSNKENVEKKFLAQNWNTINVLDGNDEKEIELAIKKAQQSDKPTIIICKTQIGFGSSLVGTNVVHGKPLNKAQIEEVRQNLNYFTQDYKIPENAKEYLQEILKQKQDKYDEYMLMLDEYKRKFPEEYKEFINMPENYNFDFSSILSSVKPDKFDGRGEGKKIINKLYEIMPNLLVGSADLTPSTKTIFDNCGFFSASDRESRNLAFGIREHSMGAISNGISLHFGTRALCSTFFSFENYMTPAIRLSAFMSVPVLYYFTHDSISVGEDGPTHQPIEQIATLRAMPNISVFRPGGINELVCAFDHFFKNSSPMAIALPRGVNKAVDDSFTGAQYGGYEVYSPKSYDITIVATGSEVNLAIETAKLLKQNKINAKVVSMPCVELFEEQSKQYQNKVINKSKPVFCIEMSSDNIWYKFATDTRNVIKLDSFGKSGKYEDVLDYFGFTPKKLTQKIESELNKQ